jgi:arylsulfatase A-like enzyme
MNKLFVSVLSIAALTGCTNNNPKSTQTPPNILIIYVDDLGYGDIGVNGAVGVETPNIDNLADKGLNLTDAHCTAATCTPSRYSLLTGSYAFRNNAAILPGDAPLLIDPKKGTLASMLQKAGYTTGVVGKWHLGLGSGIVNWNEEIVPGPREIGFDYSFLIPATGDRVPCVFVENQKVVGLNPDDPIEVSYGERLEGYPVGTEHPELLKMQADLQHSQTIVNGISRIGYMKGGKEALWVDEDFPVTLTNKAKAFITANKDNPFFLYFALHDVHVPRVTNPDFVGKSTMGPRGDAIAQVDWCTGEMLKTLEELGLSENTLIIFSSDNGPVLDDGYADKAVEMLGDHKPSGIYRGGKYSAYEAGTRMPTIVYWPGKVKPGVSDAMLNQVDLYASFASLVGQEIEEGDAPDSQDFMASWMGKSDKGRDVMLEEAFTFALRSNNWKYIHPQESKTPEWLIDKDIENGLSPDVQLYDLSSDPSEQLNLADQMPEKVAEMQNLLNEIKK